MLGTPKCYFLLSKILKLYFIIDIIKETELQSLLVEIIENIVNP